MTLSAQSEQSAPPIGSSPVIAVSSGEQEGGEGGGERGRSAASLQPSIPTHHQKKTDFHGAFFQVRQILIIATHSLIAKYQKKLQYFKYDQCFMLVLITFKVPFN